MNPNPPAYPASTLRARLLFSNRWRTRARFGVWGIVVCLCVVGTLLWLWQLRGPHILDHDAMLIRGWTLLGLPLLAIFVLLNTTPTDAIRLDGRVSIWLIVGIAALFQLATWGLLSPGLSGDLIRYRFDGGLWLSGPMPVYRAWSGIFAVVSAELIAVMLRAARRSPWWAVMFAWNPLTIIECGGMGHVDSLGVMLILLALWLGQTRHRAIALVVALLVLFLPLLLTHHGLYDWAAAKDDARRLAVVLLCTMLAVLWWKQADVATAGYWVLLVTLLAAPVVYPWYLLWPLAIAAVMPRASSFTGLSVLVWSMMIGTTYLLRHQPTWKPPGAVTLAEYAPVYCAVVAELTVWGMLRWRRRSD